MKPTQALNLSLTAILVVAIAYAVLRGLAANVDAAANDRAIEAQGQRDKLQNEVVFLRGAINDLIASADSLRAQVDSAKKHAPTPEEDRESSIKSMRYASLDAAIDTLIAP